MENGVRKKFHKAIYENDEMVIKKILYDEFKSSDDGSNHKGEFSLIKFFAGNLIKDGINKHIETIKNKQLWLSSPVAFNDPLDCYINIDPDKMVLAKTESFINTAFDSKVSKELNSLLYNQSLREDLKKQFVQMNYDQTAQLRKGLFISCFSEKSTLYKIMMWSHYANNHRGFCVEYDYREINRSRDDNDSVIPVVYSDQPDLEYDNNSPIKYKLNIAFTKSKEWAYEKEWRLLDINDQQNYGENGYLIDFIEPKRIYIGYNASEDLKNELIDYCKAAEIDVWQMKLKTGTFLLTADQVS